MTQPDAAYVMFYPSDDGHQLHGVLLDTTGRTITQPYVANAAYVIFYSNADEFDSGEKEEEDEEDTYDDDNDGLRHFYVQTTGERSHKIYYNTEGEAISPPIYRAGPRDTDALCIALTINGV
jgi:hypothetical protein